MSKLIAAEVFPPGEILRDELEARGWTQVELAEIMQRPPRVVSEIISAKRALTAETAKGLGEVFGTGGQFWMNLESAWQLSKIADGDGDVARRAELYEKAPVKEMTRRHWIEPTADVVELRSRLLTFFRTASLDDPPNFAHAARKRSCALTRPQHAWLCRSQQLAQATTAARFTKSSLPQVVGSLRALLPNPEEVRRIPRILADFGIRLVVVEPLAGTAIDGATLWLSSDAPVIALSLRFDRIDWFWFTLMHELGHVKEGDGKNCHLDTDLVGANAANNGEREEVELAADRFASEAIIDKARLDNFVARTSPLYSKQRIKAFAATAGVHPGLVVGQLQHRNEIPYSHSREMLAKVRNAVVQSALTDGWGCSPQVGA